MGTFEGGLLCFGLSTRTTWGGMAFVSNHTDVANTSQDSGCSVASNVLFLWRSVHLIHHTGQESYFVLFMICR